MTALYLAASAVSISFTNSYSGRGGARSALGQGPCPDKRSYQVPADIADRHFTDDTTVGKGGNLSILGTCIRPRTCVTALYLAASAVSISFTNSYSGLGGARSALGQGPCPEGDKSDKRSYQVPADIADRQFTDDTTVGRGGNLSILGICIRPRTCVTALFLEVGPF